MSPGEGHRVVEIGCVELLSLKSGERRQWYLNPEREIPPEATRIHGIDDARVAAAPKFREIAAEFLEFLGDSPLVIHNAAFDHGFLNAELARVPLPGIPSDRLIDTLPLAKRRFPGASASLDALCKRFRIDTTQRTLHGALLDAELLTEVYIELLGGSQFRLQLEATHEPVAGGPATGLVAEPGSLPREERPFVEPRVWPLSPDEERAHLAFLEKIQRESGGCLWAAGEGVPHG
ncbi:MAG: DNA polymerase III subunit epsilon [Magnetococcales bacterium]|nr:DNA polymerase III subunit epsilon [Magnetococcales bacterium]MBF0156932.1 DNA polymerase III subunit epsilon [Magnetococcales bacterium]